MEGVADHRHVTIAIHDRQTLQDAVGHELLLSLHSGDLKEAALQTISQSFDP